jgi:Stage II sporulation protein E (SpoIIE)
MTIATYTQPHPSHVRNGDQYQVLTTETATWVVLAHGDDTQPCGWRAAELACSSFLKKCESSTSGSVPSRLAECVEYAHREVATLFGICKGAQTGLLGLVILPDGRFWYLNVGDSHLMTYTDTTELVPMYEVRDEAYLGTAKTPPLDVQEGALLAGEGLLLLSAGAYTRGFLSLEADFYPVFNANDPQTELESVLRHYQMGQHDDLTAIVVCSC